jgi:methionyl-tRNA formyltransferase
MSDFIVAAIGEWNKDIFDKVTKEIPEAWHFTSTPNELNKLLETVNPKYIFFPHWRWVVPKDVIEKYECICFHMTDVPYGRGGSPLQNLIVRGHKKTVLSALRMEEGMDTGPVYFKEPLRLEGTAQDVFRRASKLSWQMIAYFISENL